VARGCQGSRTPTWSNVVPTRRADLVVDLHGLMHEADLDAAVAAHAARMAPGGRLLCEFHYLGALVQDSLIDTIRHGHYSYLSLLAASHVFGRHDLVVTRVQRVPTFGGSLRVVARRTRDGAGADAGVRELIRTERDSNLDSAVALNALESAARWLHPRSGTC
jgi:hypothetical protein